MDGGSVGATEPKPHKEKKIDNIFPTKDFEQELKKPSQTT